MWTLVALIVGAGLYAWADSTTKRDGIGMFMRGVCVGAWGLFVLSLLLG